MTRPSLEEKIHRAYKDATGFTGICFRNVLQLYANRDDVLSDAGSLAVGGRYNYIGAFGVIYLSCELYTCFEETLRTATALGFDVAKNLPRTVVGVRLTLTKVLNLTSPQMRRSLGLKLLVLKDPDWETIQEKEHREALTQAIGRFASEAGFEAMLVPSAACKGTNLDIFPHNLLPSAEMSVVNRENLPEHRAVIT
jgi:RES domain-containing protein